MKPELACFTNSPSPSLPLSTRRPRGSLPLDLLYMPTPLSGDGTRTVEGTRSTVHPSTRPPRLGGRVYGILDGMVSGAAGLKLTVDFRVGSI